MKTLCVKGEMIECKLAQSETLKDYENAKEIGYNTILIFNVTTIVHVLIN